MSLLVVAHETDLEDIRKIYRQTISDWWFIPTQSHRLAIEKGNVLIYKPDDEVKAYVRIREETDGIFIVELAVNKEYQNMGIGTKILEILKSTYPAITVKTNQAINFYLKNGFKATSVVEGQKKKYPVTYMNWDSGQSKINEVFG
jgi:ribosomal protein S18 acetylase RimI-like enzyme